MFWNDHFGYAGLFNRSMWEHIVDSYDGHLPIKIKAVPEGTVVPVKNVLSTFENTDDKCASLTNFLETIILQVWAPITVATNSRSIKVEILKRLLMTTDMTYDEAVGVVSFMLHDFGFRGVSSFETASILGASHLTQFMGTDNVSGIVLLMNYYNAEMCGFSVPASEHSTATPWGRGEGERQYILNMLRQHPTGIVSIVSDSYNVYDLVDVCGTDKEIKDLIINRDGKTVFRPDSGEPKQVNRKLLHSLAENFGYTTNNKGYKVLPLFIGLLQGDGIDREMVIDLLDLLEEEKFEATCLIYGSGGGLLQKFNRDTLKFAIKCSHMIINGIEVDVQKDPITAPGKKSKTGLLKLVKENGLFKTISSHDVDKKTFDSFKDEMEIVFENGIVYNTHTLDEIRKISQVKTKEL